MTKLNTKTFAVVCTAVFFQLILIANISSAKNSNSTSGWVLDAVNSASNSLEEIKRAYPDGGEPVIKAMMDLGKAHMDALQYAKAEEVYRLAVKNHKKVFKNIAGDFRHDLTLHVKLLSDLADSQLKQEKFDESTRNYRRGLNAAKLGMSVSTPEVKHMRTGLIISVARRSTKQTAESLFAQLLAASEKASGFVSDDIAMILENWIKFRGYTGRLNECEEMSTRLIDVVQRVHGSDHPEVAEALNLKASVIYSLSKDKNSDKGKEALPILRKASQIRNSAFGKDNALSIRSQKNLETLLRELYLKNKI